MQNNELTSGHVVKITDPAKTLERLFENLHNLEIELQAAINDGRSQEIIKFRRSRISATKGSITRVTRMMAG